MGRPNVGKSTLLNLVVQFRLSAVSPKPQSTRHRILGLVNGENYQVAFLDTPGMPRRASDELNRHLMSRALEAIPEADLVLVIVEPKSPADVEHRLIETLRRQEKAAILAINKIDLVKKTALLPLMDECSHLYPFLEIMPVSALKRHGVDKLLGLIVKHLPQGEAFAPADEITNVTERFLAGEMVREQVFNSYGQEVPYSVAVEVDTFQASSPDHGGKDFIRTILYVEKDSQKAILIGRGGEMLKKIGSQARPHIESLLERPVYLEQWVKVYPRWRKDKAFLKRIGY